jgi:hypothetical protein
MSAVNLWGFNVVRASNEDQARIVALKPGVLVVIGDFQLALRFKRALPDCEVIYRHYPDDRIWTKMTPQRYFDEHSRFSVDGIVVQVGNEDELDDLEKYVHWNVDLLRLVRSRPTRFAVMPFSVGRPPNHERDYQRLLPVFQEMAAQPGKHLWIPHEYFDRQIADEPGQEYIVGRFLRAWRACDAAGIPRPHTVIGEFGPAAGMNPLKGWKAAGVDRAALVEQMRVAAQRWYAANGVAVALFAWRPFGPFEAFDLATEPQILAEIGQRLFVLRGGQGGGESPAPDYPKMPAPDEGGWQRAQVTHTFVNLRAEPRIADNVTGATQKDEVVYIAEGVTFPDGENQWLVVRKLDGTMGWSRRLPFDFVPQPEPVVADVLSTAPVSEPTPAPATPLFERALVEQKIRLHLRQADLLDESARSALEQAARLKESAENERKQAQLLEEMVNLLPD